MNTERTLYYVNGSIPNWRVMLALHEKGISFTPRRLRVMCEPRETRSPEFLALNPRGQTPVLVEPDGTRVNESLAILTHLELRYPEPALLPLAEPGALARVLALVQEAETFACAYEPLEMLFMTKPSLLGDAERQTLAGALSAVAFDLSLRESRAACAPFIAGESLTLADCAFYPVLAYLLRRGLSLTAHPHLAAYEHRVRARPSAETAHPEGWLPGSVGRKNLFTLARAAVASAARPV
jgi:glutathione S-transferase